MNVNNNTVLMGAPDHFKVEYSINPWMDADVEVDIDLAKEQWSNLKKAIESAGAEVKVVPANEDLPDLVFTANSGIINGNDVLIANFKFQERQGEEAVFENWYKDNGYRVGRIPSEYKFEGRGDAFVYQDYLIGTYGIRSDKEALEFIAKKFGLTPLVNRLIDEKFYHLDTCFQLLPTGNNDAIYYPGAFEDSSLSNWSELFNLIPVSKDDAELLTCNAVVVGNTVIFPAGEISVIEKVKELGCNVVQVNVSEFIKAGGACQCLVISLN